jgi:hypothetical protein
MSANYLKKYGSSRQENRKKMRMKTIKKRVVIISKIKMRSLIKKKRFILTTGLNSPIVFTMQSENLKTRILPPRNSLLFCKKPNTQKTTL